MKPFFILGCPRSGTTLLQQALNRHPQIAIPPETKFFFSLYRAPLRRQRESIARIRRDLEIDLELPAGGVRTAGVARALFLEMLRRYALRIGRDGLTYFGEKTPEHTSRMDDIADVFPEARFLFLYRDGRDVALSLSEMPWMTPDPCVGMCIWLHYYRILRRLRHANPANVAFLRYEDLVTEPQATFDSVFRFLEVDACEAVVSQSGNIEGVPERELRWKSRALAPITSERIGRWRTALSPGEAAAVESLGGKALRELGYPLCHEESAQLRPYRLVRLAWGLARFAATLPISAMLREMQLLQRSDRGPIGRSAPLLPAELEPCDLDPAAATGSVLR